METAIFVTRKLEKIVSKNISDSIEEDNARIRKWSANVFYVKRKKCWLIVNKYSRYALVLSDIKKSDLKNITEIFIDTLYHQLDYDGLPTEHKELKKIIGDIKLLKTDNDRSTNGSINDRILSFKYWIQEFGTLENMPMRDLNGRLNRLPVETMNWEYPKDRMRELLETDA